MGKNPPNPDSALHSCSGGLIPQNKESHWYKIRSEAERLTLPARLFFFVCTNRTLRKFVLWQLEFHWTKNLGSSVGWPWTVFLEGTSAELNRCHPLLSERNFKVVLQRWVGITLRLTDGELGADRAAEIPAAVSLTVGWRQTWWLQTRFHHHLLLRPLWSLRRNCSLFLSSCSDGDDTVHCFQHAV